MYIQVEHATKQYGSGEAAIYALSDASLSIEKSEICVILGPSGSGKSTLLNMLGGLDHLDKGHIYIEGSNISAYNRKQLTEYRRQKLGFVFQSYNLIPELNVLSLLEKINREYKTRSRWKRQRWRSPTSLTMTLCCSF